MNLKQILDIIVKNKKSLILVILGSVIISSIYVFWIATPYYMSIASIIHKKEQSMMDANLGSFTAIAQNLGLGGIDSKINFYIPDIINSNMMKEKIMIL